MGNGILFLEREGRGGEGEREYIVYIYIVYWNSYAAANCKVKSRKGERE